MPDLRAVSPLADNYELLTTQSNGLGTRTLICTLAKDSGDMTNDELVSCIKALEQAGGDGTGTDTGGPDAFTVAAINAHDGTDPVYVALQGTGTPAAAPVTGFTLTVVATFEADK